MKEVETLLGFHKTNTTAYHPQTDGLVERYNHTLTAMLARQWRRENLSGTRGSFALTSFQAFRARGGGKAWGLRCAHAQILPEKVVIWILSVTLVSILSV